LKKEFRILILEESIKVNADIDVITEKVANAQAEMIIGNFNSSSTLLRTQTMHKTEKKQYSFSPCIHTNNEIISPIH
jgi:hypothetical protein